MRRSVFRSGRDDDDEILTLPRVSSETSQTTGREEVWLGGQATAFVSGIGMPPSDLKRLRMALTISGGIDMIFVDWDMLCYSFLNLLVIS